MKKGILPLLSISLIFLSFANVNPDEKDTKKNPETFVAQQQFVPAGFQTFQLKTNSTLTQLEYNVRVNYRHAITRDELNRAGTLMDIITDYPTNWIKEYEQVELSTRKNGQPLSATGANAILNQAQKELLRETEVGSMLELSVRYKADNAVSGKSENKNMKVSLMIIPEKEAVFTKGYDGLIDYLKASTKNDFAGKNLDRLQGAAVVFTITETGSVSNVRLEQTSAYPAIDSQLLHAVKSMPAWKPAEDAAGRKVKQEFVFNFGPSGC